MSQYTECVKEDTPRLAIYFERGAEVSFSFKLQGGCPMHDLIGYIGKVQAALHDTAVWQYRQCAEQALVIAWFAACSKFEWYAHIDTPKDAMCGMLEIIKQTYVQYTMARNAQAQQQRQPHRRGVIGLDGKPFGGVN